MVTLFQMSFTLNSGNNLCQGFHGPFRNSLEETWNHVIELGVLLSDAIHVTDLSNSLNHFIPESIKKSSVNEIVEI